MASDVLAIHLLALGPLHTAAPSGALLGQQVACPGQVLAVVEQRISYSCVWVRGGRRDAPVREAAYKAAFMYGRRMKSVWEASM